MWKLLYDPRVLTALANKVPGVSVERLVQIADEKYEGVATIGVPMIKRKFAGAITVLEKRALAR